LMGWDIVESGFKIVLSPRVPEVVERHLRGDVDSFLAEYGLGRGSIQHWIAHTGGPKVLRAIENALELPCNALERSWRSLREIGNLSSASVLFVLADQLAAQQAKPGDYGLLVAMGPGFCSELVLLKWYFGAQRALGVCPRRNRGRLRPLSGNGGLPHAVHRFVRTRGGILAARVSGRARMDRAGGRAGRSSATLLGHYYARPPMEHPDNRAPGRRPDDLGTLPPDTPSQLFGGGDGNDLRADDLRLLAHRARIFSRQRVAAARPHQG
jgi:hypothetical protein